MAAVRAKVTRAGQVSLPAAVRRRWDTDTVLVVDVGDYLIVRPALADPVGELLGSFCGPGPTSEDMRAEDRAAEADREGRRRR